MLCILTLCAFALFFLKKTGEAKLLNVTKKSREIGTEKIHQIIYLSTNEDFYIMVRMIYQVVRVEVTILFQET